MTDFGFLDSPKEQAEALGEHDDGGDEEDYDTNEDFIKVKIFFYNENKQLQNKVFPEEWYTIMEDQYPDEVDRKMQPWLELEV